MNSRGHPAVMVPTFGRAAVLVCGAVTLGSGLGMPVTLSVMFPDWMESFATSRAQTAAVHSTCVGILYGGGVVAGYVINRFGARVSFFLGSFLATLGMFLGAFATNLPFLWASVGILSGKVWAAQRSVSSARFGLLKDQLAQQGLGCSKISTSARFGVSKPDRNESGRDCFTLLIGCGFCLIQMPCIPSITRPFQKRQGVAIATVTSGGALVILAMPYFYDWLIHLYSWRGAFIIISGMCLNTSVLEMVMTSYSPSTELSSISSAENATLVPRSDETSVCNVSQDKTCEEISSRKLGQQQHVSGKVEMESDEKDVCLTSLPPDKEKHGGYVKEEYSETINSLKSVSPKQSLTLSKRNNIGLVDQKASDLRDSGHETEGTCVSSIHDMNGQQINLVDKSSLSKSKLESGKSINTDLTKNRLDTRAGVEVEDTTLPMSCMDRVRNSAWKFILDPLAVAILTYLGLALTGQFSVQMLPMDIAANKGLPERGLLFVIAMAIATATGKGLAGVFGLCQKLPSFLLLGTSGLLGSGALAMLGYVSSLSTTLCSIGLLGISMGVTVSTFPKCFLDLPCVDSHCYPLALGMANTMIGLFNFLIPIMVGTHLTPDYGEETCVNILSQGLNIDLPNAGLDHWTSRSESRASTTRP
ncbi:monocarboxylate transporter 2 [Elysia marginata]|uniref:Monocarboxylate transporter 2 n=1 Tax=Elysia marginata TaxID=1093978 RepID=A0AAV4GK82_9GAST|nr:monocarboxylate transporter 2 [Elysia marginata]